MVLIHNVVALVDVLHVINSVLSAVQIHLHNNVSGAALTMNHMNPCYRCQIDLHMVVVKTDSDTAESLSAGVCVEELISHLLRYDRTEGINLSIIQGPGGSVLAVNNTSLSHTIVPEGDQKVPTCACRPKSVRGEDVPAIVKRCLHDKDDYTYDFMNAFTSSLPDSTCLVFKHHGTGCSAPVINSWSFVADAGLLKTCLTISHEIAETSGETIPASTEVIPISV